MLEFLFAATALNHAVLLANPAYTVSKLMELCERSGAHALVHEGKIETVNTLRPADPPSGVIVPFTSGTTSSPKGVMLTYEAIYHNAKSTVSSFPLHEAPRTLVVKGLHHISPITTQVVAALLTGGTIVLPSSPITPLRLVQLIESKEIGYVDSVGTLVSLALDAAKAKGMRLDEPVLYTLNGESVSGKVFAELQEYFENSSFYYAYGLTEAGPRVTMLSPAEMKRKPRSVGKPLDGVEVEIDLRSRGTNAKTGEIVIRSPSVMSGYWNNPELTKQKLNGGKLRTGDCGYLDQDGYLYVTGRTDEMLIRAGHNIYPQEIEETILSMDGIKDCVVMGEADDLFGARIIAYVVPALADGPTKAEVYQFIRQELPPHCIPQEIVFQSQLLLTPAFKKVRGSSRPRW